MFLYGCLPLDIQKLLHARFGIGLSHGLAVSPEASSLPDMSGSLVEANTDHRLPMLCLALAESREGRREVMSGCLLLTHQTAMSGTLMS